MRACIVCIALRCPPCCPQRPALSHAVYSWVFSLACMLVPVPPPVVRLFSSSAPPTTVAVRRLCLCACAPRRTVSADADVQVKLPHLVRRQPGWRRQTVSPSVAFLRTFAVGCLLSGAGVVLMLVASGLVEWFTFASGDISSSVGLWWRCDAVATQEHCSQGTRAALARNFHVNSPPSTCPLPRRYVVAPDSDEERRRGG